MYNCFNRLFQFLRKSNIECIIPLTHLTTATLCPKLLQSCPTLCDPMDCSPPRSSVHGILQARIVETVAISFSRESSRPRDRTCVSCIADRFFIICKVILYHPSTTEARRVHLVEKSLKWEMYTLPGSHRKVT